MMIKTFTTALFVLTLNAIAQIPTNGLVAWYPFTKNANDTTSHQYHGIVHGAMPTTDRFGNDSSAYQFNGSEYIEVPYITPFNGNSLTVSAWIQTGDSSGAGGRVVVLPTWGLQHFSINAGTSCVNNGANTRYTKASIYSDPNFGSCTPADVTDGLWHHLVGVIDSVNMVESVYLDGVFASQIPCGTPVVGSFNLRIGGYALGNWAEYYTGKIDEVSFYNRALTAQEITNLYNGLTTSVTKNVSQHNVSIFPNPSQGAFTIQSKEEIKKVHIKVINLIGESIYEETASNLVLKNIQLNSVAKGCYTLQIDCDGQLLNKKIVIY